MEISLYFLFMFIFKIIFIYYIICIVQYINIGKKNEFFVDIRSFLITFIINFVSSLLIIILRFIGLIYKILYL